MDKTVIIEGIEGCLPHLFFNVPLLAAINAHRLAKQLISADSIINEACAAGPGSLYSLLPCPAL